ncbi:hypothetical protein GCM10027408_17610 [Microbacterium tumbae]
MKMRTRRALALAGSAAALSLALTGCSVLNGIIGGGGDAPRDDDNNVTEESNIDIFSLQVGDCLPETDMNGGETSDTDVVPCDEAHSYEVYHEFDLADGDYPGSDAIYDQAVSECTTAFEAFIGISWDDSSLDFTWYEPTEASWGQANDRLVQCLVYDTAGSVKGSLKGVAR